MDTGQLVELFADLFRGRVDCRGSWAGGCVHEPVTRRHYAQHLDGGPYIGVYPLIGEHVTWGCIDIDGKDHPDAGTWDWVEMRDIANKLVAALDYKHVTAWREITRNGIHVWIFPEDATPANVMRNALLAACDAISYIPKEVNPKSIRGGNTGIGNYVRLPYPNGLVEIPEERFVIGDDGAPLPLIEFVNEADRSRTTIESLNHLASLHHERKPATLNLDGINPDLDSEALWLVPLLKGLSAHIWHNGPLQGNDRSTTLMRLAHLMVEQGIAPREAFILLRAADQRWGKFHARSDGMENLQRILERAYGAHT